MTLAAPASLPRGTLVVLGGGDDDPLLAILADLLPTREGIVEVVTTATREKPERTAAAYARALHLLGCPNVGHLPVDEDHAPDDPTTLARLRAASLVFLTGGDQERLADFLLGTEFLALLNRRYHREEGFIVAGTSAGASAMGGPMIVEGVGWRSLLGGGTTVCPGLGLRPRLIFDQHFAERNRYPRLLYAAMGHPECLALGLSEETGLIIRPDQTAEVFGDGVVFLLDPQDMSYTNVDDLARGRPLSGHGLRLHLLVAGQRLNLTTREVE